MLLVFHYLFGTFPDQFFLLLQSSLYSQQAWIFQLNIQIPASPQYHGGVTVHTDTWIKACLLALITNITPLPVQKTACNLPVTKFACKQPTKLGAEKSHKTFFIGVTKSMPCLISQSYFYIIKLFSCYVKNTCVYNLPGFHYAPSHKSGPGAGKGLAW